jgi:hypothetical protein
MKRAELAINVVIIAVIAVIVLIVLAVILLKGLGTSGETAFACENGGGTCEPGTACPTDTGQTYFRYVIGDSGCKKQNQGQNYVCCRAQE